MPDEQPIEFPAVAWPAHAATLSIAHAGLLRAVMVDPLLVASLALGETGSAARWRNARADHPQDAAFISCVAGVLGLACARRIELRVVGASVWVRRVSAIDETSASDPTEAILLRGDEMSLVDAIGEGFRREGTVQAFLYSHRPTFAGLDRPTILDGLRCATALAETYMAADEERQAVPDPDGYSDMLTSVEECVASSIQRAGREGLASWLLSPPFAFP